MRTYTAIALALALGGVLVFVHGALYLDATDAILAEQEQSLREDVRKALEITFLRGLVLSAELGLALQAGRITPDQADYCVAKMTELLWASENDWNRGQDAHCLRGQWLGAVLRGLDETP